MLFRNKKGILAMLAIACMVLFAGTAIAADENELDELAADENELDELTLSGEQAKPKPKVKKPGQKDVEAKASPQAPAPENPFPLDPAALKALNDIQTEIQIQGKILELETIRTRQMENLKKRQEAIPEPKVDAEKTEQAKRVFPMPGGNPHVESVLGGSKRAMEATLVFPTGAKVDVSKGTVLEGGYMVTKITGSGVTIEKDGKGVTLMLIAAGKNYKALAGDGNEEQGQPVQSSGTLNAAQPK